MSMSGARSPARTGRASPPKAAGLLCGAIAFLAAAVLGWIEAVPPATLLLRAGLAGLAVGGLALVLGALGRMALSEVRREEEPRREKEPRRAEASAPPPVPHDASSRNTLQAARPEPPKGGGSL